MLGNVAADAHDIAAPVVAGLPALLHAAVRARGPGDPLLLHAAGASASELRITAAAPLRVGGERGFWQRVAGSGLRERMVQREREALQRRHDRS